MQTTTEEPAALVIPDNIEELIAAYLKEQAARYPEPENAHLIVYTQPDGMFVLASLWSNPMPIKSAGGRSIKDAVGEIVTQIAQLESEAQP